jgi:hypothetical protein
LGGSESYDRTLKEEEACFRGVSNGDRAWRIDHYWPSLCDAFDLINRLWNIINNRRTAESSLGEENRNKKKKLRASLWSTELRSACSGTAWGRTLFGHGCGHVRAWKQGTRIAPGHVTIRLRRGEQAKRKRNTTNEGGGKPNAPRSQKSAALSVKDDDCEETLGDELRTTQKPTGR